jgi:hypothetical protein
VCGAHRDSEQRYCLECKAAYMRKWRKTHPPSDAQRLKDIARSIAHSSRARGKLTPQPCERCQSVRVEMHHDDYSQPLAVRWLCKAHHAERHREIGEVLPAPIPKPSLRYSARSYKKDY